MVVLMVEVVNNSIRSCNNKRRSSKPRQKIAVFWQGGGRGVPRAGPGHRSERYLGGLLGERTPYPHTRHPCVTKTKHV